MPVPKPSLRTLFLEALDIEDAAQRAAYLDHACGSDAVLRRQVEELIASNAEASGFLTRELAAGAGQTPMEADPHPSVTAPLKEPLDPNQLGPLAQTVLAPGAFVGIDCKPGDTIGRYKLLEKLGEGGFGVVYMAEQREPVRRKVALKIIKVGMDTREVVARFEAERQALALMDHPNIAKILDGGVTGAPVAAGVSPAVEPGVPPGGDGVEISSGLESSRPDPGGKMPPFTAGGTPAATLPAGRPYFVMELVRGIRITDFCDQNQLGLQERLELFMQVCHAVQHAHQKGIIHRDLKPSNILVTINDGVPVPKVIDFGIAKATQQELTEKTLFTAYGQFMGTPAYMSPEQTVMTSLDIDTRSDIYSLGVLLYELLTGKPPFDTRELLKVGLDELCRTLREVEPPRPSTRMKQERLAQLGASAKSKIKNPKSQIATDLDWIVMKCLEKDRARRYETANGLAADLQRHLSNEPVVARPPSTAYRLQKLVRRNKGAFAAGTAVAAALLVGLVVSTWQAVRAIRAEREQILLRQQAELARSNEVQLRLRAEILQTNETRLRRRSQTEKGKAEEVAEFFKRILRGVRPEVAKSRDTTVLRELLEQTVARMHRELTNQPEVQVEVARSLAHSYERLEDYRRAEVIYRQVLPWAEAAFGRTNLFVSQVILDIPIEILNGGDRDPDRLAEAESLTRECLAISVQHFGSNHADQIGILNVLAGVQKRRGDEAGAEAVLREALTIVRNDPGKETGQAAQSLAKLSERVMVRGDYAEATALMEEALPWMRKAHGPTNLHMATALDHLGQFAQLSHEYRRAMALREECLAMNRAVFGKASREVAHSLANVGWTAHWLGDFARAERAFREQLAVCRKVYGDLHRETASALDGLLRVLAIRPQSDETLDLLREMLAIERKAGATNQTRLALSLSGDAELLTALGRFSEAESIAREALQHLEPGTGARDEDILAGKAALGWALAERAWAEQKTASKSGLETPGSVQRAREAEQLLQDGLAARLRGAQPGHWHTAELRGRLGGALVTRAAIEPALSPQARIDDLAEAETLLLGSHAALQQAHEVEVIFRRAALQRLARLYEAWDELTPNTGKAERAVEWRRKLTEFEKTNTKPAGGEA